MPAERRRSQPRTARPKPVRGTFRTLRPSTPPDAGSRRRLERLARQAAARAYAPYSGFRVGAAVQTEKGVFSGCNVENASYGLCLCAERSALAAARAGGAVRISAVAVVCLDAQADLGLQGRTPCGACRQWLLELAPDAEVILGGVAQTFRVTDLLPHGFTLSLAPAAAGEVAAQPVLPQDGE